MGTRSIEALTVLETHGPRDLRHLQRREMTVP